MPLFGGGKRADLGGITKDEQKRRDSLLPEVHVRMAAAGHPSEDEALGAVLVDKAASDKSDFLWPLLVGWRQNGQRHYTDAIASFNDAASRDGKQVRCFYGAAVAYFQAGMAAQGGGSGVTAEQVPPGMSIATLFQESGRCYSTAISLTTDKVELQHLREAVETVDKAIASAVTKN